MILIDLVYLAAFAFLVTSSVLLVRYLRLRSRFKPIVDLDAEADRLRAEMASLTAQRHTLETQYREARVTYDRLRHEVSLLEENLEDMSFGVYRPHYNFDSSETYKAKLEEAWERKKALVRVGQAAVCATTWTVSGSQREGARMTKQAIKVMLRAFNGEADAAVAKVTWNNVTRMEERIRTAYNAINSLGVVQQVTITPQYLEVALAELRLTYEYERKKHDEQEEQRRIREQKREEDRAQRDYERAQREAATDQERYERALSRARAEVEKAVGEQVHAAKEQVQELERKLAEAQAKMQRAVSMAEQTRAGYVYVLSNVGSFGEGTFKIGLTRRLDPMERVHELGDASVPFPFDVHALIYTEDGPNLEAAFHEKFDDRRVNLVNTRKEYFRASLPEIEEFARSQGITVEFIRLTEAQEFRETSALRTQAAGPTAASAQPEAKFPEHLLEGVLPVP